MKDKINKQKEKETKPSRKRLSGEWLLILIVLVISGITAFLYTRAELTGSESGGTEIETATPVVETEAAI